MRFLLDNNLWAYIAEAGADDLVVQSAVRHRVDIIIAPSVVYETLATTAVDRRDAILKLQARGRWKRLLPEAYYEAEEIRGEIARLQPQWLTPRPDLRQFRMNVADWRRDKPRGKTKKDRGFWGRLVRDPNFMAIASEFPWLAEAREQTLEARRIASSQKLHKPANWMNDDHVWREGARRSVELHLAMRNNPYRDWLLPFLANRPWIDSPTAWREFWATGVNRISLIRQWLRWASEYLQQWAKWTPGNPADSQLSTYWVDADFFVTADKRLLAQLTEIASVAPREIATGLLVPGGRQAVDSLIELICETPKNA